MDFQEVYTGEIEDEWKPERPFGTANPILIAVLIHFSAAPTTSEKLIISYATDKGDEFETEIFSVDPVGTPGRGNAPALTNLFINSPSLELPLLPGEYIKIAYPNTDERTIGITMKAKYVA